MSSKAIVSVENVHLIYRSHFYHQRGLRDYFVDVVKSPLATVFRPREHIPVLKGVNFEVRRGDRIGLLGVNGAGKTSLCRCLAGYYVPQRGKVKIQGQVRAIFDTRIGIFPELSGRENAKLLMGFMYPDDRQNHAEMIEEALEFSELGHFVDMPFRTYSNGMQARLCLSVISSQPSELLILDEVFDGADQFFREKISKRIVNMIEQSGAVIFVSHSNSQIEQVCNRVVLLNKGQVVFDGPPDEGIRLYNQIKA